MHSVLLRVCVSSMIVTFLELCPHFSHCFWWPTVAEKKSQLSQALTLLYDTCCASPHCIFSEDQEEINWAGACSLRLASLTLFLFLSGPDHVSLLWQQTRAPARDAHQHSLRHQGSASGQAVPGPVPGYHLCVWLPGNVQAGKSWGWDAAPTGVPSGTPPASTPRHILSYSSKDSPLKTPLHGLCEGKVTHIGNDFVVYFSKTNLISSQ